MKKFAFYLKGSTKPVIITDEDNSNASSISEEVKKVFQADKVYTFQTNNDILIGRPSELQAILVTDNDRFHDDDDKNEKTKKEIPVTPPQESKITPSDKEFKTPHESSVSAIPPKSKEPEPVKKKNVIKMEPSRENLGSSSTSSPKRVMSLEEVRKKIEANKNLENAEFNKVLKDYEQNLSFSESDVT